MKQKTFNLTCLICLILMGVLLVMQFLPSWTIGEDFMSTIKNPKQIPADYAGTGDYTVSMWKYIAFPDDHKAVTKYFEKHYKDHYEEHPEDKPADKINEKGKAIDVSGYDVKSIILVPWGLLLCIAFGIIVGLVMQKDVAIPLGATIAGLIGVIWYGKAWLRVGALSISNLWVVHIALYAVVLVLGVLLLVDFFKKLVELRKRWG